MRKDLLAIGLGTVLSGVTVFSSLADGTVTLRNHVPKIVQQGKAEVRGHVEGDTKLTLSLGLPLRNQAALSNFLNQVNDPNSPNFHQYLTSQQFADQFGPTEEDYNAVKEFARKNGFKVTSTSANRMVLTVTGQAADVEKTFGVTLNEYKSSTEGRQFIAPDREPSVPTGLKVQDIQGLGDFFGSRPKYRINQVFSNQVFTADSKPSESGVAKRNGAATKLGSGPGQTYMGDDFRRAYVPKTALTGSGQTVALYQGDGYFLSDIIAYENLTGRPNVPLQNILIDGFSGTPTGNGGEVEVSLDIEMVISMAPNVSKIMLYEGNFLLQNDILNQIATDNAAKQVGCSWGFLGGPSLTTDQIFQQMAAQGQTFFDASGDIDAFLPGEVDDPTTFNAPSDNPFITQVGGTTLSMNGAGGSYASEVVWNADPVGGSGSSGGISAFYGIPTWQTNINMVARGGSATKRNIPDVAMIADNVFVIADGGVGLDVGGTSVAAPLWAGFTALVNQQGALNGRPPVGFINPALYSIANNPTTYASCFNDITVGNNSWSGSPSLFNAFPGYDLCTGLGSPKSTNLINALISFGAPVVHISPPPPPYGSTMAALNGGNPNGQWMMFLQDDAPISSGLLANGWILNLTTADLVGTAGDIELLVSTTNTTAFVGQTATFTVTVTNYGPSALSTNVTVVDTLPLNTTIISTNATQGTVSRTGTTLNWNVGNLALNAGAAMTLTVKSSAAGNLVDTATVSTGTPDPNPDDDTSFAGANFVPLTATLSPVFTNGNFLISIPGPTNPTLTVIIQANSNLVSTNWVNVFTGQPPINFVDPAATGSGSRFYRAILLP